MSITKDMQSDPLQSAEVLDSNQYDNGKELWELESKVTVWN